MRKGGTIAKGSGLAERMQNVLAGLEEEEEEAIDDCPVSSTLPSSGGKEKTKTGDRSGGEGGVRGKAAGRASQAGARAENEVRLAVRPFGWLVGLLVWWILLDDKLVGWCFGVLVGWLVS